MSRILVAGALLVSLAGCGAPGAGESPGRDAPARCAGTATASVSGELRRVRMQVTPCRVVSGKAPRLVLTNLGEAPVGYGPGFRLERKTSEGWRWINRRQAFPLPLIYLGPGERSEPETVAVYYDEPDPVALAPGLYRVTKGVQLTPGRPRPPTMEVSATFRVTD